MDDENDDDLIDEDPDDLAERTEEAMHRLFDELGCCRTEEVTTLTDALATLNHVRRDLVGWAP